LVGRDVARDGLAIVINAHNTVVTYPHHLSRLRDIYSGKISNWSALGGEKAQIHVFTREDGSGTRSSFETLVMGKTEINPRAMVQDSNGAVRQLVGDDPDAIGYISLGSGRQNCLKLWN